MLLPVHWVNHRIDSRLSILDRGFSYGDGLFETLRCHKGRFHLLDLHMRRLRLGCERLEIACPDESLHEHFQVASQYLKKHNIIDATLRLSVSRGSALGGLPGRGYGGAHGEPNIVFSLFPCRQPWRHVPAPARLIRYSTPLSTHSSLAGIKHCNRLEQVLAAQSVQRQNADEAVMFNQAGEPVCAVAANLYVVAGDAVYTSDLSGCGVAGTVRALVLGELAASCMIHVEQRAMRPGDLLEAEEVILSNSLIGIQSVASVNGKQYSSTLVADRLRSVFFEWVDANSQ